MKRLSAIFILFIGIHVSTSESDDPAQTKFLSVVFRHGDRTPDANGLELYPNDPYANFSFLPIGLGGLTNQGKLRLYRLGSKIREIYGNFIGDDYVPNDVYSRSTDYGRTKMSLQLVLGGLYPPKGSQIWHNTLNWQPIPTEYVPKLDDNLMVPEECPQYLRERLKVEATSEVKEKYNKYETFMRNLTELTGRTIKNSNNMYFLYHCLMAERSMNLSLPEWTKNIFPTGLLLDGTNLEYEISGYNTVLRRLNGGSLIRQIIQDMQLVQNGTLQRKINLFSGHETNIAAVLQTLGTYKPHVPEYSSSVFIELVEKNGDYFVKVMYNHGIPPVIVDQQIPDCDILCPLQKFIELMEPQIPSDEEMICDRRTPDPNRPPKPYEV